VALQSTLLGAILVPLGYSKKSKPEKITVYYIIMRPQFGILYQIKRDHVEIHPCVPSIAKYLK
jgi:hypothetical protein